MRVLIANLGSTSFKYKLFDMDPSTGSGQDSDEAVLARGAADRIGDPPDAPPGDWSVTAGDQQRAGQAAFADHGEAVDLHLQHLVELGVLESIEALDAIGFKAVHGGPISGAVVVDDDVLATMERFADVAPAHNPPYIAAMKAFAERLPNVKQVAAFETAFHQTIPPARQAYAVPHRWIEELGVRRYGFHGASHRYIATRMAQVMPSAKRVINCHLGGSSSMCAICDGQSVATSMGLTPQSGLPQGGRVGDFEIFALLKLRAAGMDTDEILHALGKQSGLAGLSGISADMRDIEAAADDGNAQAKLAIDVFVEALRHYIGAYAAVLNGVDAIVFTGGIGQHQHRIRAAAMADMDYLGVALDETKNTQAPGDAESRIDADGSDVALWVMPTNEEVIVARQTVDVLKSLES